MTLTETQKPETMKSAPRFGESIFSDDRVRSRAYAIYDMRRHSGIFGDATADWIAAETELKTDNKTIKLSRIDANSQ
jgi:hypothetical protein